MTVFNGAKSRRIAELEQKLAAVQERSNLLDEACGIGLWEAVLHNGDALHAQSLWTWSAEFRRLIGYTDAKSFPNVVQSWSDKLHPDDVAPTFAAFAKHLEDKTGRSRYSVVYRLKMYDGSYQWFRATGGCAHQADGKTIRACGSLTNINDEILLKERMEREAESDRVTVGALAEALSELAEGNLTHRITAEFTAKTAGLRSDFNKTASRLQETLNAVSHATSGILSGSSEISTSSDDLSKRTEQQAASLEQTAAALDQITVNVANSSKRTEEARSVAVQANNSAAESGKVVADAVDAMHKIEQSSNEISNIIGVIDEIAFQTNLLALNAGVEAARAGEAGKGFAVVAQEVRELAQRSAKAAKEIKDLIRNSSVEVQSGVKLVSETGEALKTIEGYIVTINQHMESIATSAREQSVGLAEVNTAVNQMDQVTQQNAAMVEESNAASATLAEEAGRLSHLISQFQLDNASRHDSYATPTQVNYRSATSPSRRMTGQVTRAFSGKAA
jgi:methyl-accepting chemotaxis protein